MERLLENCKKHCNELKVIQLLRPDEFSFDEKISQSISDEFPNVELYGITFLLELRGEWKYKMTRLNKSFLPKICKRPY